MNSTVRTSRTARRSETPLWKRPLHALAFVAAVAVVGFGVPFLWLLIAAAIQGEAGQFRMTAETAIALFPGICLTYAVVGYIAGTIAERLQPDSEKRPTRTIYPWMRSMRDQPAQTESATGIEKAFITAAVAVSIAFMLWFFLWAGSPLPN